MDKEKKLQIEYNRASIYFTGGLTTAIIILALMDQTSGLLSSILNFAAWLGMGAMLVKGGIILFRAEREKRELED